MIKAIGVGLLVAGVILIMLGISASESVSSDIARLFTGASTDRAIWLLLSGIVASAVGFWMSARPAGGS